MVRTTDAIFKMHHHARRYHPLHDHDFLPHSDTQLPLPIVVRCYYYNC